MFDLFLTGALSILQGLLGGMGLYVALRPPKSSDHLRWIIAFALVTLAGVSLTIWVAGRANTAQEGLNNQLSDLREIQAREEGELKTTTEIMEGIAKTGIPGLREFATSVLNAIQFPKQASPQAPVITNAQLCQRATSLALKIRSFERGYNAREESERNNWLSQMAGKTQAEQIALERGSVQQEVQRMQNHRQEFVDKYMSDVKYDHDQIVNRLTPDQRDQLVRNNGNEEASISVGQLIGADSGYRTATYLDQLAKTLCSK
jgi:hypothetical protein